MPSPDRLTRDDLQLLHEALSYARKRVFQPGEAIRVQGILDQVEDLLLSSPGKPRALRLSPPEQEVLEREIPLYCDAMTQRGASIEGAAQARRLRRILSILTGADEGPGTWLRKFFGR